MTRIEMITFENEEKFLAAIKLALNGKEATRDYKDKDGNNKTVKIISNNRIYLGGNLSIQISKGNDGKIYLSNDIFTVDDRIAVAVKNKQVQEINV